MTESNPEDAFIPEGVTVEYVVTELHGTAPVPVATFESKDSAELWADDHYENVSVGVPDPGMKLPDAFVHKVRRFGDRK